MTRKLAVVEPKEKGAQTMGREQLLEMASDYRGYQLKYEIRRFDGHVESVVNGLQRMINEVRREGWAERTDNRTPAQRAEAIQHAILWGVANLGLGEMTGLANACQKTEQTAFAYECAAWATITEQPEPDLP